MNIDIKIKVCNGPLCNGKEQPIGFFSKCKRDGYQNWCKKCRSEYNKKLGGNEKKRKRLHERNIYQPLGENKDSTTFLGIYVAERVLSKVFKNVKKMPYGNPGFDFVCNKGYKIDVKSSTLKRNSSNTQAWQFIIKKNYIPDYFLLLGFDNRDGLNPLKIWLIPVHILYNKSSFTITNTFIPLKKWEQYELKDKLEQVIACCNILKGEV